MNRPLMIGPDGLVVSATKREVAHLSHCLERGVKPLQRFESECDKPDTVFLRRLK